MLSLKKNLEAINFKSPLLLYLFGLFIVWFALFYEAIFSAIRIWHISEIFTHGFFVLPGAFYFIWREREKLAAIEPKPNYLVFLLLVPFLFLGLLGRAGGVEVFAHVSAFTVLPLMLWLVLGNQIAKVIWFPLCFMLFSIPIGEELVPFLQKITADMAVFLLNFTSIPSFNTGLYIEIPAGKFVVAEACSGIRFFIGSLVFGAVYSHISYYSFKRKFAFMLLAILVPVVANALRVFSIVLIGHFVDMKYASGADHLVYGWVFFGIVLFVLVLIGESIRDKPELDKTDVAIINPNEEVPGFNSAFSQKGIMVCGVLLVAAFVWQIKILPSKEAVLSKIDIPQISDSFRSKPLNQGWRVLVNGYSDLLEGYLKLSRLNQTNAIIAWYPQNTEGKELISSGNALFDKEYWSRQLETTHFFGDDFNVGLLEIVSVSGQRRLVLYWYQLNGVAYASRFKAKLYQAVDVMSSGSGGGALIALSLPFVDSNREEVKQRLIAEAKAFAPDLLKALPF